VKEWVPFATFEEYKTINGLVMRKQISLVMIILMLLNALLVQKLVGQNNPEVINNPIMDGYFADPSILLFEGSYYIFATIDPWGSDELAVFETTDFKKFNRKHINWPTKKACTSPTSGDAMVWAPSVVMGPNGKLFMYVSVGSEVWVGTADHPLGPWKNAKTDGSPLIAGNKIPGYHMIDAECFIDDDKQAYLYWGSGLNWVNGKCFAVALEADMVGFKTAPKDITPPNYFEGPVMMKKNQTYYLMYSNGKAIDASYNVRYAIAKSPFGPFTEGENSPILKTSADSTTYGPGHHCVFTANGQDYILYHRILPQQESYVLRQLCIDSLIFDNQGNLRSIQPKGVAKFSIKSK
jgi:beta-xylosidase